MMADIEKPLSGVTVVELGHSVAAPYAGLILADLGARVIKVENPGGGDYARGWGPPFWRDTASVFHALNRGKEGHYGRFPRCARLREAEVAHP
jgi:crotonobetainyl-CoA:carnitine CoA-transferase CaiB-like acyl-CoA transferase